MTQSRQAPLRLGVIGAGLIWMREHQKALAQLPEAFEPVAFCDIDAQRRAAVALDFPNAAVLERHEDLLALPQVEAVLVLTPIALNAPVALAALRAGKHVIVEKPIACGVAEAQTLLRQARASDLRLCVAEHMAYRPADDTLADFLKGGEIGDVVLWEFVQHFAVDPDPAQGALRYDNTSWRKAGAFPLGSMFDGGIHRVAVLSKVFGQPSAVTASGRKLREGYGDYDHVGALLHYPGGAAGMLSYSQSMPPKHEHFHIHGSKGMLVVERQRMIARVGGAADREIALPAGDGRMAMWRAFARVFTVGGESGYTAENAMGDVATLEAVEQSIKLRQRITL